MKEGAQVTGFIGSPAMNFIKGNLKRNGGDATVQTADGITLPLAPSTAGSDGQSVVYGVRPEHLTQSDQGVPATVTVIEPTGSEIQVLGKIGGQDISAIFRERHKFAPGHGIGLTPTLDHVHLFDAESGSRL